MDAVQARGVRLNFMRNRPATWVIAVLLMLQLALPWQAANASSALPEHPLREASLCPGHQSTDLAKHDCCHSLGCQCHSAQSPGALNPPPTRVTFPSLHLLPAFDALPPVARTAEFFRPPIA
jgi:hypothetical protein